VEAVVLLASVGPGCVNGWDRLLAAPGTGQLCALVAWRLTPWIARARIARIARRRGRPLRPDEHVNWYIWGHASREHGPLWRTFLAEQRALLRELDELESAIPAIQAPVLLLADPQDHQVPVDTGRPLACNSSRGPVITCPDAPQVPSPMRWWRSWPRWISPPARRRARRLTCPGSNAGGP
jgi:pimeloyl-ACP methyl ester carboxylesterase